MPADPRTSGFPLRPGGGNAARLALLTFLAATAAALALLLDRVGAPARMVLVIPPLVGLGLLAFTGISLRTMQVSRFFVAGRGLPTVYGGLASGGVLLAIWLMLWPGLASVQELPGLVAALGAGQFAAALAVAPLMRKSGAFSLAGFLSFRFSGRYFRLAAVGLCAMIAALAALAGMQGGVHGLTVATGLPSLAGALLFGAALAAIAVPGGLGGAAWASVAAAGCMLGALLIALALQWFQEGFPPLGETPGLAAMLLARAEGLMPWPGSQAGSGVPPLWVLAMAMAVFSAVTGFSIAAPGPAAASRTAACGLGWGAALAALALGCMAATLTGLEREFTGRSAFDLPELAYAASAKGEILICGKAVATPGAASAACAERKTKGLQQGDIRPSPLALLTGLGIARNPPAAVPGLILAAYVLLHLGFAALAVQALATTLAHEGLYLLGDSLALTSRRLAASRIMLLLATGAGVAAGRWTLAEPGQLLGLALWLSAVLGAPMLLLAIWPLATGRDAWMGLACAAVAAFMHLPQFAGPSALAVAAACLGGGIFSSLFHRRASRPFGFFRALWGGGGDVMPPDRGA